MVIWGKWTNKEIWDSIFGTNSTNETQRRPDEQVEIGHVGVGATGAIKNALRKQADRLTADS
jgi:hypothetical protein